MRCVLLGMLCAGVFTTCCALCVLKQAVHCVLGGRLCTVCMCVQREQAQAVQSLHEAKRRLARQVQVVQADRDSYKAESEKEHKELLQAAETQQHLQEQIRSGPYMCSLHRS